jgi:hypothetical protein
MFDGLLGIIGTPLGDTCVKIIPQENTYHPQVYGHKLFEHDTSDRKDGIYTRRSPSMDEISTHYILKYQKMCGDIPNVNIVGNSIEISSTVRNHKVEIKHGFIGKVGLNNGML